MKISSMPLKQAKKKKRKSSVSLELIDKMLPIVNGVKLNHLTTIIIEATDGISIRDAKKGIIEASRLAKRYFTIKKTSATTLTLKRIAAKLVKEKLKKKKVSNKKVKEEG